jgi:hypothetical protein
VLVMAGALKRERLGQSEATVLLTALRDSNLPKFLADDAILFSVGVTQKKWFYCNQKKLTQLSLSPHPLQSILSDLFPGVELPSHDYGKLQAAIEACFTVRGLQIVPALVRKVIQFYETMVVRHGVMLVGPTGGGKTTVYQVSSSFFFFKKVVLFSTRSRLNFSSFWRDADFAGGVDEAVQRRRCAQRLPAREHVCAQPQGREHG